MFATAEMTEIIMPEDTNHYGTAFGGKIMQWIDKAAAIAAYRFAGKCVTASIDSLQFNRPIHLGDIVTLKANVNKSWKTSMEVGVKVWCQDRRTGKEYVACRAYLTFVAIAKKASSNAKSMDYCKREIMHEVTPGTAMHWKWYNGAEDRRKKRLEARKEKK